MGDRSNSWLTTADSAHEGLALYSHWGGSDMPETLRKALAFGKERWTDSNYLARVIVTKMTEEDADGLTGSGLSPKIVTSGDGYPVTIVALDTQMVHFAEEGNERDVDRWSTGIPFGEYIKQTRSYPNAETEATAARIAELEQELRELRGE